MSFAAASASRHRYTRSREPRLVVDCPSEPELSAADENELLILADTRAMGVRSPKRVQI
jgi:hypothetical protein